MPDVNTNVTNSTPTATINWGENSMNNWLFDSGEANNSYTTAYDIVIKNGTEKKICIGSLEAILNNDKTTVTIQANKPAEWLNLNELKTEIKLQKRKNRNIVLLTVAAGIMAVALAAGLITLGVIVNSSAVPAGFVVGAGIILTVGAGSTFTGVNKFDSDRVAKLQKHLRALEKRLEKSSTTPQPVDPDTMTENPIQGITIS